MIPSVVPDTNAFSFLQLLPSKFYNRCATRELDGQNTDDYI